MQKKDLLSEAKSTLYSHRFASEDDQQKNDDFQVHEWLCLYSTRRCSHSSVLLLLYCGTIESKALSPSSAFWFAESARAFFKFDPLFAA